MQYNDDYHTGLAVIISARVAIACSRSHGTGSTKMKLAYCNNDPIMHGAAAITLSMRTKIRNAHAGMLVVQ